MKKIEKTLLFILIISICLVTGFFAYRNFIQDKIDSNNEEINVGDNRPCCSSCGNNAYCLAHCQNCATSTPKPTTTPFNCSGLSQSSCSSGAASSYCAWCQGGCKSKSACTTPKTTKKSCGSIGSVTECTNNGCEWSYSSGCKEKKTCSISNCKSYSCKTNTCCKCSKCDDGYKLSNDGNTCKKTSCDSYGTISECSKGANCTWNYSYGCLENKVPNGGCGAGRGAVAGGGKLECRDCESGYYSKYGDNQCHYCNGTVSSDKTKCEKQCASDEYMSNGECKTCYGTIVTAKNNGAVSCKPCEITFKPQKILSPGDGVLIFGYTSSNCRSGVEFEVYVSGNGASLVGNKSRGNSGVVLGNNLKDCADISFGVVAKYKGVTVTEASETRQVTSKWREQKDGEFDEEPPRSSLKADSQGSLVMSSNKCKPTTNDDGATVYVCPTYQSRSCGNGVSKKYYSYCCVDNGLPGLSKNVFYVNSVKTKDCATYAAKKGYPEANYTLLENYDRNNCKAPDKIVGMCTESSTSPTRQEKNANECESNVQMTINEGVKCSNTNDTSTGFYKIDCDRYVTTKFDYGNDGKTNTDRTLHKGEGIVLGINVDSSIKCTYEFYNDNWTKVYNSAISKIKNVDSKLETYVVNNDSKGWENYIKNTILKIKGVSQARLLYEWWNIIEELKDIVKYYNSYEPANVNNDENAVVSITTKENGKSLTKNYNFTGVVTDNGKVTKTDKVKKAVNVKGLDDPYNFKSSSTSNPTKVTLVPKKVCIDNTSGEIVSALANGSCPKNSIDGGNKMYINYTTDLTKDKETYPINIKVSGLSINNSMVINNKCTIKVVENELLYRPIEVRNPFINDSWKKGDNWVNSQYDFTKVIHANTWTEATYNKISISSSDIVEIQRSNARNQSLSPYLGLCDKVDSASQDSITQKICKAINK